MSGSTSPDQEAMPVMSLPLVKLRRVVPQIPFVGWVLIFGFSAFFFPKLYTWNWSGFAPKQMILPLVQLVMLGMGLTLTMEDFARVLKRPGAVILGTVAQYLIMPVLAWIYVSLFQLEGEVAAGLILIGCCPGGVSSNVICYLARANVPLSVTFSISTTLVSPLATPLFFKFLAGKEIHLNVPEMMLSIVTMILVPVLVGMALNHFARQIVTRLTRVLPTVAMFSICLIIAITIALARDDLMSVGLLLFAAAACHNASGYILGYTTAFLGGMNPRDCRTVAIEVGLQNGGMATGLALHVLNSPRMALGSAVFGPWSAVTSSMLASYWHRRISATEDKAEVVLDRPVD